MRKFIRTKKKILTMYNFIFTNKYFVFHIIILYCLLNSNKQTFLSIYISKNPLGDS